MRKTTKTLAIIVIALIAIISIVSPILISLGFDNLVYTEFGVLEISQAFVLLLSMIMFLFALFTNKNDEAMISLFGSTICYAFILREVEFDEMGLPDICNFMLHDGGRTITIVSLLVIIAIGVCRRFKDYTSKVKNYIFSIRALLIFTAIGLLFLGYFFEKSDFKYYELGEELSELWGYALIFLCSIVSSLKNISKKITA